jgi:alcohol dehydrogenase
VNSWPNLAPLTPHPTELSLGEPLFPALRKRFKNQKVLFLSSSGWKKRGLTQAVQTTLMAEKCEVESLELPTSNPNFIDIESFLPKVSAADAILAIGGGSVLDLAKAFAVLKAPAGPQFADFKEIVKAGKSFMDVTPIPLVAVPTTAGTGSEVTPFATVWDSLEKRKYSLAGPKLYPQLAILDPSLTLSLPWDLTLSTGLDALSQCLESVWNWNARPPLIKVAARGIKLALEALPQLEANLSSLALRGDLLEASLLSGLCISTTRTALAHSISYPLTAHYGTPHGLACSFTLPALWDLNFSVDDGRMAELCGHLKMKPQDFGQQLRNLHKKLKLAKHFFRTIPVHDNLTSRIDEMFTKGRADNNLHPVGPEVVSRILETSLSDLRSADV